MIILVYITNPIPSHPWNGDIFLGTKNEQNPVFVLSLNIHPRELSLSQTQRVDQNWALEIMLDV